jgi:hypothetical protein
MHKIDDPHRDDFIESLLEKKFGKWLHWAAPDVTKTVGPFYPDAFQDFAKHHGNMIDAARNCLELCDDDGLKALCAGDTNKYPINLRNWDEYLRREINDLARLMPAWFSGGFGNPAYLADFNYWSQMRYFSLGEAVCLSLGVDPRHFTEKKLLDLGRGADKVRLSPPLVFLTKRVEQFRREFPPHVPNYRKISPGKLFQWFAAIDLEVHPDFSTKYVSTSSSDTRDRHTVKATKTDRREVDSVAQLFAAMAIDAYGYDPTALRSPIPKEIRDIAASLGMEISDDTIRKYLKLGAKFISPDWKPN